MSLYSCTHCKVEFSETNEAQRYRYRKTGRIFCNINCGMANRETRRTPEWAPKRAERPHVACCMCGEPADMSGHRLTQFNATGRAYCGKRCSAEFCRLKSSETMAATNRVHASARMRARNPMVSAEVRGRVAATLRAMGHAPLKRGGNGRDIPLPEAVLNALFVPHGFVPQLAIKTGQRAGSGYPPSYKPDCAHPVLKIAIEADGTSHAGKRRTLDEKRDALLVSLGWRVLRFRNETILRDPAAVVAAVGVCG